MVMGAPMGAEGPGEMIDANGRMGEWIFIF